MGFPEFANPWFLLLLLLVPLLIWRWWVRKPFAWRYSSTGEVKNLLSGREWWVRFCGTTFRAAALILLILALAGPRWPDLRTRYPTHGIAIGLVLDASSSMSEDFPWQGRAFTRFEAAKKALQLLVAGDGEKLAGRANDLIGLVVYGTRPETACPLTLDHDALLKILEAEKIRSTSAEATSNLGDALAWTLHRLKEAPTRRKVLIVLTEGEHNEPPPALTPRQAAQIAGNLAIPIYAIHTGPSDEETKALDPEAIKEILKAKKNLLEITQLTKGQFFAVHDGEALLQVCRRIDELERDEIPSYRYRRYYEGFVWFALASFILLFLVHGLEATIWRKVP